MLLMVLLLLVYKVSIYIIFVADVRIGIRTEPVLRDGIKFAVAAWGEELDKFCDVPRLDSKAHKFVVKYVYE